MRSELVWGLPLGTPFIFIWHAGIDSIPAAYFFCDGTHNTPDLRNHFVRGARLAGDIGTTGGADTTVRSHHHTFPDDSLSGFYSDPESAHAHVFAGATEAVPANEGAGFSPPVGGGGTHAHAISGGTIHTYPHDHLVIGSTTDVIESLDLRPPWVAYPYVKGAVAIPVGAIALADLSAADLLRAPGTLLGHLAADMGEFDTTCTVDTPATGELRVLIGDEEVWVGNTGSGTDWSFVIRGFDGTTRVAHPAGTPIYYPQYAVCDGTNGTPQLLQACALGAGGLYVVGQQYGTNNQSIAFDHGHRQGTVAAVATSHTHDLGDVDFPETVDTAAPDVTSTGSILSPGNFVAASHRHDFRITSDPSSHTHTFAHSPGAPIPTYDDPTALALGGRWSRLYYVQRLSGGGDTMPVGGILWWPGPLGSWPANYRLCDGAGGTPNLTNRAVVCVGGDYAVADNGMSGPDDRAHDHGVGTAQLQDGTQSFHDWDSTVESSAAPVFSALSVVTANLPVYSGAPHSHAWSSHVDFPDTPAGNIPSVTEGEHGHPMTGRYALTDLASGLPLVCALYPIQKVTP